MPTNEAFLIVEKPAKVDAWFMEQYEKRDWLGHIKHIRESLPFLNPSAYRGISRNPLMAFLYGDLNILREIHWSDIDINTAAQ